MSRPAAALGQLARARSPIWWSVLAVALCGVVATAHGLYEVVLHCSVPAGIAMLYVPITDGLALVAYASTDRLRGFSRAYAWMVVLAAAGLSAVAQAMQLGGLGEPPVGLRYGVGAWPAIAVAIAAHLLYLVARPVEVARDAPAGDPVSPAEVTHEAPDDVAREAPNEALTEPARAAPDEVPREAAVAPHRLTAVPAAVHQARRTVSRPASTGKRVTVRCDAGCGRDVSRATRTRHRGNGCAVAATG